MFQIPVNQHIGLHLLQRYHAEELFKLIDKNRDHLRAWLAWVDDSKSAHDIECFIESALLKFSNSEAVHTAIYYNTTMVGSIGLVYTNPFGKAASMGYWISKEMQGKGIVTQAACKLMEYAFTVMNMNKIEIRAAVHNAKSCAIPQRLGFTLEGTVRSAQLLRETFIDMNLYGLLKNEWEHSSYRH